MPSPKNGYNLFWRSFTISMDLEYEDILSEKNLLSIFDDIYLIHWSVRLSRRRGEDRVKGMDGYCYFSKLGVSLY